MFVASLKENYKQEHRYANQSSHPSNIPYHKHTKIYLYRKTVQNFLTNWKW